MEQDILDRLYLGKITPWDTDYDHSPEAQAIIEQVNDDIETLSAMLPDDGRRILDRLMDCRTEQASLAVRDGFKDGFRFGAKLTLATFCNDKGFGGVNQ